MSDDRDESVSVPKDWHDFIKKADKILILGFGFDPINVERLGIPWKEVRAPIYYINRAIPSSLMEELKQRFGLGNSGAVICSDLCSAINEISNTKNIK